MFFVLVLPPAGTRWDPLFLAIAVALSSTVIIVKMLYEKREARHPARPYYARRAGTAEISFAILFLAVQPMISTI